MLECFSLMLQKGKSKGATAALQALQPQLSQSAAAAAAAADDGDPEASQLEQDIQATSELLESFNAHSDTWEALEVGH